jgi:hypothetical protein
MQSDFLRVKFMSAVPIASLESSTSQCSDPRIAVSNSEGEFRVVALSRFEPGDIVMKINGLICTKPNRYSVQVGRNLHVYPPDSIQHENDTDRYLWRFVNHSCRPNTAVMRKRLVAILPIAAGEEIVFDYNANEFDMAEPFRCRCGHCSGIEIRGFHYLNVAQRQSRYHVLADHLRDLMDDGHS